MSTRARLSKTGRDFQGFQNGAEVGLEPCVALFFLCYTPFEPNGLRFDPFESNGVEVLEVPWQGAQSGGGEGEEETSSLQQGLARPIKGSAGPPSWGRCGVEGTPTQHQRNTNATAPKVGDAAA